MVKSGLYFFFNSGKTAVTARRPMRTTISPNMRTLILISSNDQALSPWPIRLGRKMTNKCPIALMPKFDIGILPARRHAEILFGIGILTLGFVIFYLAYSTTLVSLMTFTLISPGYWSSASIFLAISWAILTAPRSSISVGVTKMRTS